MCYACAWVRPRNYKNYHSLLYNNVHRASIHLHRVLLQIMSNIIPLLRQLTGISYFLTCTSRKKKNWNEISLLDHSQLHVTCLILHDLVLKVEQSIFKRLDISIANKFHLFIVSIMCHCYKKKSIVRDAKYK